MTTTTTTATTLSDMSSRIPLPSLSWADGAEMWNFMLEKDAAYCKLRSEHLLDSHPSLVHNHRTILFDWLSEVSHELKFHRETYHLALDFIDRYLAATADVGRHQLQLIGTTCLFLAAKYEEIRPPTVNEFAELTDGACRAEEIIDYEVVILSAINWDITPQTPNSWLTTFALQLVLNIDEHKRIASVVDLALLDINSLRFSSSVLTASAIYHFTNDETILQCTGFKYRELADCIHWLVPFVDTIKAITGPIFMASCKGESHPTQMHSHIATANLLEQVYYKMYLIRRQSLKRKACSLEQEEAEEEEELRRLLAQQEQVSRVGSEDNCDVGSSASTDTGAPTSSTSMSAASPPRPITTTVLLTPPSSTSKSRRKRFRDETSSVAGAAPARRSKDDK